MSDFDWPADIVPHNVSFYLQPHTGGSESPFSRKTKVYGLSASRWVCRLSVRGGDSDKWGTAGKALWGQRMDAFLAQVEGRLNRVILWDFRRPGGAKPFTNDAVASGTSTVLLVGASEDDIRVGDYVGGDGRPHMIIALTVDGLNLSATVKPHFENDIAAGAATFDRVTGYFRLTSDDAGNNPSPNGEHTEYNLEFVEDWGPSTAIVFEGEPLTYSGS